MFIIQIYDDTYIATKHIQGLPLVLVDDLVSKLESAVSDAGLYFDDEDLLKEIATGLIKGSINGRVCLRHS